MNTCRIALLISIFLIINSISLIPVRADSLDFETAQNYSQAYQNEVSLIYSECNYYEDKVEVMGDCTVTIKAENLEVEITVYDISWWDCLKLKAANWWYHTFH